MWREADGLDPDDFDPKTFFKLHGNVGRRPAAAARGSTFTFCCFRRQRRRVPGPGGAGGALQQRGWNLRGGPTPADPAARRHFGADRPGSRFHACVLPQLEKVYADDSEDGAVQMEVERTRMRNHVMAEVRSAAAATAQVM